MDVTATGQHPNNAPTQPALFSDAQRGFLGGGVLYTVGLLFAPLAYREALNGNWENSAILLALMAIGCLPGAALLGMGFGEQERQNRERSPLVPNPS
jgi:hypothetical protein